MSIVCDIDKLKIPCKKIDVFSSMKIIERLENELLKHKNGIGLSANQIGLEYCVAVVRYKDVKINLVNPVIVEKFDLRLFKFDGCLSFPGQRITTERYNEIFVIDNMYPYGFVSCGMEAVVIQHECLPHDSMINTEHGLMSIKHIVDSKYKGKVLSFDIKNGNRKWNNIIGWNKKSNISKKKWVVVKFSNTGPNKQLKCTEDHVCAFLNDPIDNLDIQYTHAKNLNDKYIIRNIDIRDKNSEHPLFNKEQMCIIIGCLLGDLCIDKRGVGISNHGRNQKKYAMFKSNLLGGKTFPSYSGYLGAYSNTCVVLPITEQTKILREKCYNPHKNPEWIANRLTEISLAFWFMDDGCCGYTKGEFQHVQFHTESFGYDSVEILKNTLNKKFGFVASIYRRLVNGSEKYILSLNKDSSISLLDSIVKYIPECMEYKIPKEYRGMDKYIFDNKKLDFSCKRVNNIYYLKTYQSALYDLEIEYNHNFFANNTLVHNCDHLNGLTMFDREISTPERNGQCWCKSGKKFKKCCLGKEIQLG